MWLHYLWVAAASVALTTAAAAKTANNHSLSNPDFLHSVVVSLNDDDEHKSYDTDTFVGHPCDRECVSGEPSMVCKYSMAAELYNTLSKACYDCPHNMTDCNRPHCVSADGIERGIIVINRYTNIHIYYAISCIKTINIDSF